MPGTPGSERLGHKSAKLIFINAIFVKAICSIETANRKACADLKS